MENTKKLRITLNEYGLFKELANKAKERFEILNRTSIALYVSVSKTFCDKYGY